MAGKSAAVRVAIIADNTSFMRGLRKSETALGRFGYQAAKVAKTAAIAGVALAAAAAKVGFDAVKAASENAQVLRQTAQVIKTTGGAAGVTADQVEQLSMKLAYQAGISDEAAQSVANLVLTFKNVRNVGAAKIFDETTKAAIDMSAALKTDGKSSAIMLGKALNDPVKGLTALTRVGVTFTKQQKEQIKKLAETGQTLKAQKLILKEVQSEFGGTAKAIATPSQRLATMWGRMQVTLGKALLPAVEDLTNYFTAHAIPKISEFAEEIATHQGEIRQWGQKIIEAAKAIGELAGRMAESLWPVLKATGETIRGLVTWFQGLGDHSKRIVAEVALATIAFIKFGPAIMAAGAGLRTFAAEALVAETRTAALGRATALAGKAAKTAAGIGGMLALAEGAQSTHTQVKLLLDTLGGAATGFAVGGPWGALIGGAAGLAMGVFADKTNHAQTTVQEFVPDVQALADTFYGLTARITESTRAEVLSDLQKSKLIGTLGSLGVSQRTAVNAALGNVAAQGKVAAAYARGQESIRKNAQEIGATGSSVSQLSGNLTDSQAKWKSYLGVVDQARESAKADARATGTLREVLGATAEQMKAFPPRLRTKISNNFPETRKEAKRLADQLNLTPKQRKILLSAPGLEDTKRKLKGVRDEAGKVGAAKPNFKPLKNATETALAGLMGITRTKGKAVGKAGAEGVAAGAKPDLSTFKHKVTSGVTAAKGPAYTGGYGVGSNLKSGTLAGVGGLGDSLSTIMASAVTRSIAAANAAADAHSPSRKTMKLGRDLAKGLEIGVTRGSAGVEQALEQLSKRTTDILAKQLAARERAIRARLKGKAETAALKQLRTAWRAHAKAVDHAGAAIEKRLKANGRAQDALASGNYLTYLAKTSKLYRGMAEAGVHNLEEARQHLADLQQAAKDYAANIRDVFVAYGDITQLGRNEETGGVVLKDLVHQLEDRARQAKHFADQLAEFAKAGLSQTVIDQLIAAGPEQGAATAEAIAQGIKEGGLAFITGAGGINDLTAQIEQAGVGLGKTLNAKFNQAGIDAAAGLVKGLEKAQTDLNRAAENMAKALVRVVKKELGIKSPSAVMARLGEQTAAGLARGITRHTHASTAAGARLAKAVVTGYGSPQLSAAAVSNGPAGAGALKVEVRLTAQQVSALERGRAIQLDLDAYRAAGGRGAAR